MHSVCLAKPHAAAHVENALLPVYNSFGGLEISESVIDPEAGCNATQQCVGSQVESPATVECVQCGKHMCASGTADVQKCKRCLNHSFVGVANQQSDNASANVISNVPSVQEAAVEVVPLNQFTRAGKRGLYEVFGVIHLKQPDVAQVNVADVSSKISKKQKVVAEKCGGIDKCVDAFNQAAM